MGDVVPPYLKNTEGESGLSSPTSASLSVPTCGFQSRLSCEERLCLVALDLPFRVD